MTAQPPRSYFEARSRPLAALGLGLTLVVMISSCAKSDKTAPADWQSLFDGKNVAPWEVADFGAAGEVKVENGLLMLPAGALHTGVRWVHPFPKVGYEIRLEAMRVEGNDFFCGLTFPYGETCASLILGGWGGGVCGISSIDYMDAADNSTSSYREFENGKWYKVRLRVTKGLLEAWLDDEKIIDVEVEEKRVGTRSEIDPCRPLGLCSWQTTAALRNIEWRPAKRGDSTPPPSSAGPQQSSL